MTKDAPTPKRKDAEALNKVNAINSPATKATKARDRNELKAKRLTARAAYMRGEESALPLRDKGPIKRYVRNYVDSRRNIGEYILPAIFVMLILMSLGSSRKGHVTGMAYVGLLIMYLAIAYTIVSGFVMTRRIRKTVAAKFPGESTKGLGMYGWLRSTQMRRMRAPAPQVKRGDSS